MADSSQPTDAPDLRFECTLCGECCRVRGSYAHVYVEEEEQKLLAHFLGCTVEEFLEKHTYQDLLGWTQLKFEDDRCSFLDPETGGCSVHPARPIQCRTFPFWRELVSGGTWTDEARGMCEGVDKGQSHSWDDVLRTMRLQESMDAD